VFTVVQADAVLLLVLSTQTWEARDGMTKPPLGVRVWYVPLFTSGAFSIKVCECFRRHEGVLRRIRRDFTSFVFFVHESSRCVSCGKKKQCPLCGARVAKGDGSRV
jgi:hypothetical protein